MHALRCAQLAREAATPEGQQPLLRLERSWLRLAVEVEDAQKFLTVLESIELDDSIEAEKAIKPGDGPEPPSPQ
jgi:hypothetical protein